MLTLKKTEFEGNIPYATHMVKRRFTNLVFFRISTQTNNLSGLEVAKNCVDNFSHSRKKYTKLIALIMILNSRRKRPSKSRKYGAMKKWRGI